jgi:hypothetical protein
MEGEYEAAKSRLMSADGYFTRQPAAVVIVFFPVVVAS